MAYQTIDDHLGNWYKAKRCENIENLFNYLGAYLNEIVKLKT